MVWYGMEWYGMVWYGDGMVWYGYGMVGIVPYGRKRAVPEAEQIIIKDPQPAVGALWRYVLEEIRSHC